MKAAIIGALLGAVACAVAEPEGQAQVHVIESEIPVEDLYDRHCVGCHGARGAGDGRAANYCFPAPRDFGAGRFALISGRGSGPSHEDLVRTLTGGMPGTAMPAFGWLSAEDRHRLARYVLDLAVERTAARLVYEAEQHGRELPEEVAFERARSSLDPGEPVLVPPGLDPPMPELGRTLYEENCAACHGDQGTGAGVVLPRLANGQPSWARDFTAGVLKGGASRAALAARVLCGVPSGGMPSMHLNGEQLAALIDYVQSLIPEKSIERLAMRRSEIQAVRVDQAPTGPEDPIWQESEPIGVALAQLDWRRDSVQRVSMSAVHDGEFLAIRVEWEDATKDDRAMGHGGGTDACALMLSERPNPPLDGMGSQGEALLVWQWRAAAWERLAGALDLFQHGISASDIPSLGGGHQGESGRSFDARGLSTLATERGMGKQMNAEGIWKAGRWQVAIHRSLQPTGSEDLALAPGDRVSVAPAVWNASAGDAGPRKSFGLWQVVVLQR